MELTGDGGGKAPALARSQPGRAHADQLGPPGRAAGADGRPRRLVGRLYPPRPGARARRLRCRSPPPAHPVTPAAPGPRRASCWVATTRRWQPGVRQQVVLLRGPLVPGPLARPARMGCRAASGPPVREPVRPAVPELPDAEPWDRCPGVVRCPRAGLQREATDRARELGQHLSPGGSAAARNRPARWCRIASSHGSGRRPR